jgi:hypothetical protein
MTKEIAYDRIFSSDKKLVDRGYRVKGIVICEGADSIFQGKQASLQGVLKIKRF